MSLTSEDLKGIQGIIQQEVEPLKKDISDIKVNVGNLTASVDSFMHTVRRHEEEWLVLRAQHTKIRNVLVAKGIVTEDELAVA